MERLLLDEGGGKSEILASLILTRNELICVRGIQRTQTMSVAREVARRLGEIRLADKPDDQLCAMVQLTF